MGENEIVSQHEQHHSMMMTALRRAPTDKRYGWDGAAVTPCERQKDGRAHARRHRRRDGSVGCFITDIAINMFPLPHALGEGRAAAAGLAGRRHGQGSVCVLGYVLL